jgi:ribose 5-phosphate isomerase RpiB
VDGALVNSVTEQVVRMLRQRGLTVSSSAGPAPAASVPAAALTTRKAESAPQTRKVFITAEMLTQRLAAAGGGLVELASNEFLTPGAVDLADSRRLTVRRAAAAAAPPAPVVPAGSPSASAAAPPPTPPCACARLGIITHRPDEKVRGVLLALARDAVTVTDLTQGDCWIANLRRLCQAVAAGEVASGAAILPYAADAMAVAGKIKGIRPVQGTRPESVAAALRHFGANLLVLEHAFSTHHQMRTMLRAIAGGGRGADASLEAALVELERA